MAPSKSNVNPPCAGGHDQWLADTRVTNRVAVFDQRVEQSATLLGRSKSHDDLRIISRDRRQNTFLRFNSDARKSIRSRTTSADESGRTDSAARSFQRLLTITRRSDLEPPHEPGRASAHHGASPRAGDLVLAALLARRPRRSVAPGTLAHATRAESALTGNTWGGASSRRTASPTAVCASLLPYFVDRKKDVIRRRSEPA
jgi:hypothetical protein